MHAVLSGNHMQVTAGGAVQVSVVPEPVDTWQNIKGGGNILDAFYKQPERYAYTFQNYVFLTRCMQVLNSAGALLVLACPIQHMREQDCR